jgi:dehydrogenase/reductase SDR family protein 12
MPLSLRRHLAIPLAELSVAASYGRAGYRLRAPDFPPDALPTSLHGTIHVVTGATSGIGLETARTLSHLGATAVLVGRNTERLAALTAELPNAIAEPCDLSSLAATRALADRLRARFPHIHSLIHNAGLIAPARRITQEGHESAFATHILSPSLLTLALTPSLAPAGRVVWVSSGGMYTQRLDLDAARALTGPYRPVRTYAQHKRAQVLLSEHFAATLPPTVTSNAMHPGWVDTPGVKSGLPRFHRLLRPVLRPPALGADTIVWLATSPSLATTSGLFFLDRTPRRTELFPWTRHTGADRRALWAAVHDAIAPYLPTSPDPTHSAVPSPPDIC